MGNAIEFLWFTGYMLLAFAAMMWLTDLWFDHDNATRKTGARQYAKR